MIDLHCHILPGVDDGPATPQQCIEMAKRAVKTGITHLFATPHHMNGQFENPKQHILQKVLEFNRILESEKIPLTLHPGQELRLHRELFHTLKRDDVLTLNNQGKYLLIELPSGEVPAYTQGLIYELLLKGITPVIVHPERNRELIEDSNLLFELVLEGALMQLTAGSLLGHFGKKIKIFSERMIEHHLAHFIATDAHGINSRGFSLHEAYDKITKIFGIQRTYYFHENAELLLLGQTPHIEQPVPIKNKILGIF